MIIQGAHMNYGFMQKLAGHNRGGFPGSHPVAGDAQSGQHPGQYLSVKSGNNELGIGRTPQLDASAKPEKQPKNLPDTVGAAFANEIIRRMGETEGEDGKPKDAAGLAHSLGSTVDWLRDRFGEETGAAAAGMILQSTSSEVTEETLSDGLLNTLRFIDRNFGFAAGDGAIAHFNSGINKAVNAFFDNGREELFFAAQAPQGKAGPSATARFISQALKTSGADDDLKELDNVLNDLKGELDKIGKLNNLVTKLEDQFNPAKTSPQAAMAAYGDAPGNAQPQLTSLSV